jgi:hypothetical protein
MTVTHHSSLIFNNSWFEYIAYHYAVDGFHDVRKLNAVTPHLGYANLNPLEIRGMLEINASISSSG